MDSHQQYAHRTGQDVPPLLPIEMLGTLQYMDSSFTAAKVDISGVIDKGPFLSSDQEWTCYRRNYLTCVCSFTLTPNCSGAGMQFLSNSSMGGSQTLQVYGFAMCISAMVADNEQHNIELVQHTPKRDKGPISKPTKTPLAPKLGSAPHVSSLGLYPDTSGHTSSRGGIYGDNFGATQQGVNHQVPTEHTFERIQFKQATQNNGKRRAAQQYYHLVVELWADVGSQLPEQYIKVAFRKSAKMIVRGRSPGHYQNERRNSQGNGAGGSAGSAGYRPMSGLGDFGNGAALAGAALGSYNATYDGRSGGYHAVRHQYMSPESMFNTSEDKAVLGNGSKAYSQYYSSPSYENSVDRVDNIFGSRTGSEALHGGLGGGASTDRKPKAEFDFNMLPSPFSGGARADDHHRDRFDGRPSSGGFYPSIVSPTGMNTL